MLGSTVFLPKSNDQMLGTTMSTDDELKKKLLIPEINEDTFFKASL